MTTSSPLTEEFSILAPHLNHPAGSRPRPIKSESCELGLGIVLSADADSSMHRGWRSGAPTTTEVPRGITPEKAVVKAERTSFPTQVPAAPGVVSTPVDCHHRAGAGRGKDLLEMKVL